MNNLLFKFLSKYIELTDEEKSIVFRLSSIKEYKKGSILLSEGEVAKECYFLLDGGLMSYYIIDGENKITDFFLDQDSVIPLSYSTNNPSEHYLECIEDSIIAIGTNERMEKILKSVPKLAKLAPEYLSDQLISQKVKYNQLKKLTPEERYKKLQSSSPHLLNRVPQYMIASYLGIKPETLSRIRNRIHNQ
ncbi:Crp/Fnr family transcriptional regulator [Winogradskyella sp.]